MSGGGSEGHRQFTLACDENLLGLAAALQRLATSSTGVDLVTAGQPRTAGFFELGTLDPNWIPELGRRGWVVLLHDKHIRTNPQEAPLAMRHRLKAVHIYGIGHLTMWRQAERLFSLWRHVERQQDTKPTGPWWLSLRASGAKELPYQPGVIERPRLIGQQSSPKRSHPQPPPRGKSSPTRPPP